VNKVYSQDLPTPVAHYTFDEDASDETGEYDGTLENDADIIDDADRGSVLELIDSGYVTIPIELADELEDFSFTTWIKYAGTVQWAGLMGLGMNTAKVAPYWDFHVRADSNLSFYGSASEVWPGDGTAAQVVDFKITSEWTHIAFTFTLGTGGAVYVNGELQTLEDWNSSNDHDVSPSILGAEVFTIGRDAFNQGTLTNTLIDDFRFFDKALTEEEVSAIYNYVPNSIENKNLTNDISKIQIYPNPVNSEANIKFHIPESKHIKLSVFNMYGQEIDVIVDDFRNSGTYSVRFDCSDLVSGIYFIRLDSDGLYAAKRMNILKSLTYE
jgi:hypothetical protein